MKLYRTVRLIDLLFIHSLHEGKGGRKEVEKERNKIDEEVAMQRCDARAYHPGRGNREYYKVHDETFT